MWPLPTLHRLLLLVLLLFACSLAARQEAAPVKQAIEDFLRVQTKGLPGQVSFIVGNIDPQNGLAPCPAFEVSMPVGARLWGNTNVKVHCQNENGWNIFVPVKVRIIGDYLITAHPLSQGQVIVETDLAKNRGDLASLPGGILTETSQAIGKTLAQSVASGHPLRSDMLRQAMVVQQGQGVKVLSKGPGFQVTGGEGRAMNNAMDGQVVQVRMANGHMVSGIARTGGVVEVAY
ncbi:MAG: flagellar basal body P-ring formation chaperone FlgA [Sterolibacterium sp.]